MSLKMTDFSLVSCFVSCFDNTRYRTMCPHNICCCQPKLKKKRGSWQRYWLKISWIHSAFLMNKGLGYGMEVKLLQ